LVDFSVRRSGGVVEPVEVCLEAAGELVVGSMWMDALAGDGCGGKERKK
jgi:hypothetical protein